MATGELVCVTFAAQAHVTFCTLAGNAMSELCCATATRLSSNIIQLSLLLITYCLLIISYRYKCNSKYFDFVPMYILYTAIEYCASQLCCSMVFWRVLELYCVEAQLGATRNRSCAQEPSLHNASRADLNPRSQVLGPRPARSLIASTGKTSRRP